MSKRSEADDALFVAVLCVCEKSFFTLVEPCEPVRFAVLVQKAAGIIPADDAPEPAAVQPPDWLKASVDFVGTFSTGTIEVLLPKGLGRWLVASVLGISREVGLGEVELPDGQTFDGIGEFANMICGAWLTELDDSQAFTIGSPVVTSLPAGWSPQTSVKEGQRGHCLCVNNFPMQVFVRTSTD